MPTLNINGNVRTNTAAGWGADATVYSGKTILITTDVLYTGTDVRKFKIADGTQTWTNLDYFPDVNAAIALLGLPSILAVDAKTNGIPITSNDGDSYVDLQDNSVGIWLDKGAVYAGIDFLTTFLDLQHSARIVLNAPQVRLQQESASMFVTTDGSKDLETVKTIPTGDVVGTSDNQTLTTKIIDLTSNTLSGTKAQFNTACSDGDFVYTDNAALTDARYRKMFAYQNTNSTHTGTTAETVLAALSIAANSMGANDRLMIEQQMFCVGTAGTKTWRLYTNTTADLTGTPIQIGTLTQTATNLTAGIRRVVVNKNSQSTNEVFPIGTSAVSDVVQAAAAQTTTNINFAVQQYLIVSMQLSNLADTGVLSNIQLFIDKA
jgi:hypothetical protein